MQPAAHHEEVEVRRPLFTDVGSGSLARNNKAFDMGSRPKDVELGLAGEATHLTRVCGTDVFLDVFKPRSDADRVFWPRWPPNFRYQDSGCSK